MWRRPEGTIPSRQAQRTGRRILVRATRERVDRRAERTAPGSRAESFTDRMFAPVDIASLVFFRIAFGGLMAWEVVRYLSFGWVRRYYMEPTFNFTYYGFDWVQPWPGDLMIAHFVVLGALSVLIILGLWYRVATTLFFLGFTYVFLLDQARYLNHFYLIILISFLMIFVPAHRAFSVDARRRPDIRSSTTPAWGLWILRLQVGIVYFFSGVAKLNADWLQGEPLRGWLAARTDFPIIGGLFDEVWLVYLFAYASLLLDLFAFPLLLWRRTRLLTFGALVVFHLMNAGLFSIGIFPWLAIAATTLFFEPGWPRRLLDKRRDRRAMSARGRPQARARAVTDRKAPATRRATLVLLGVYVTIQVLVPLRHFVYPGEVSWTEEGHRFSWHMMLRHKDGQARFFVTAPDSDQTFEVDPTLYLADWQYDPPLVDRPYLILQFAHHLADLFSPPEGPRVEVRAHVMVSLNSRPHQALIDPRVDLARIEPSLPPADWIVPLGSNLERPPPPT